MISRFDNFAVIQGCSGHSNDSDSIRFSSCPVGFVPTPGIRALFIRVPLPRTSNRDRHGLGCAGVSFYPFTSDSCSIPSHRTKSEACATELMRVQRWSSRDGQKKARYKLSPRVALMWVFSCVSVGNLRRGFAFFSFIH